MRDIAAFRRVLLAAGVVSAVTFITASPTAHAAPQGTCTTGSYVETTVGSDTVGKFEAPGGASSTGCTWTVPAGVTSVRLLVVAGGGGGGGYLTSGGGGGGGVIQEVGFVVSPGASVSVTVGKGGAAGTNAWNQPGNYNNGVNGNDSVFGSLTAIGGGGGGGGGTNSQIGNAGSVGGSGGGGGRCWVTCNTSLVSANSNKKAGGAGTAGQGYRGGDAPFMSGGGGGGAGAAGWRARAAPPETAETASRSTFRVQLRTTPVVAAAEARTRHPAQAEVSAAEVSVPQTATATVTLVRPAPAAVAVVHATAPPV